MERKWHTNAETNQVFTKLDEISHGSIDFLLKATQIQTPNAVYCMLLLSSAVTHSTLCVAGYDLPMQATAQSLIKNQNISNVSWRYSKHRNIFVHLPHVNQSYFFDLSIV